MSDQPDNIVLPDAEETALIEFESQTATLNVAHVAANTVADALDYLHSIGADSGALDDIHGGASDLLLAAEQLSTSLYGAVSMAKTFREQRDEFRVALAEFKHAVEKADTSVPEVEEFWSIVEQANMDWLSYSFDDWGRLVDELTVVTPLTEEESIDLVKVLGSEELPTDHALWDTLRDWIADAKRVIDEERGS